MVLFENDKISEKVYITSLFNSFSFNSGDIIIRKEEIINGPIIFGGDVNMINQIISGNSDCQ